jgi:hypothetical protein
LRSRERVNHVLVAVRELYREAVARGLLGGEVLQVDSSDLGVHARAPSAEDDSLDPMAAREQLSIDLDAEVAAILRARATEAHVSEGEIVARAIRAYDLRALVARIRERNDLDQEQAMALAREELKAAHASADSRLHSILPLPRHCLTMPSPRLDGASTHRPRIQSAQGRCAITGLKIRRQDQRVGVDDPPATRCASRQDRRRSWPGRR